jgi:predicted AAA+ superfamily ATPase
VLQGARFFPVIAILGPRQSGKTTLAQQIFKQHIYVSLEDLDLRAAASSDPRTFLIANSNEYGIIIDEFQHVPELLSYIQTIADREQKPGYFILTGSQNFLMNEKISQSLAGRVSIHTLLPLSVHELQENKIIIPEIEHMLYQGCYPAIYAKHIPPQLLYANYLQTYVERDVRQLANIGDLTTFQTFITLCAARIGQLLNITSLGNECGISDTTVKRWLSILQASYIIFLLRPYHTSFGKRLVKTPKIYFYDTGLATHLLKIKQDDLALHPNRGGLFESFIISEILKWYYNHGTLPSLYFWRDSVGHEVDCILEDGQKLVPIEIKSSRTTNQRFFEGLEYWNSISKQSLENGFVVFAGSAHQIRGRANLISWQSMQQIFDTIP